MFEQGLVLDWKDLDWFGYVWVGLLGFGKVWIFLNRFGQDMIGYDSI